MLGKMPEAAEVAEHTHTEGRIIDFHPCTELHVNEQHTPPVFEASHSTHSGSHLKNEPSRTPKCFVSSSSLPLLPATFLGSEIFINEPNEDSHQSIHSISKPHYNPDQPQSDSVNATKCIIPCISLPALPTHSVTDKKFTPMVSSLSTRPDKLDTTPSQLHMYFERFDTGVQPLRKSLILGKHGYIFLDQFDSTRPDDMHDLMSERMLRRGLMLELRQKTLDLQRVLGSRRRL